MLCDYLVRKNIVIETQRHTRLTPNVLSSLNVSPQHSSLHTALPPSPVFRKAASCCCCCCVGGSVLLILLCGPDSSKPHTRTHPQPGKEHTHAHTHAHTRRQITPAPRNLINNILDTSSECHSERMGAGEYRFRQTIMQRQGWMDS